MFDLNAAIPQLEPGLNLFAVQLLNSGLTSSDLLFVPELIAELEPISTSPYEQWFAASTGTSGLDNSPTLDLDTDGLNNLLEFAFGGNPTIANPQSLLPTISENRFSYRSRINSATTGLSYLLESSPDLKEGTWTPAANLPTSTSGTGSPEIELIRVTLPATAGRRYFRLRVELAE